MTKKRNTQDEKTLTQQDVCLETVLTETFHKFLITEVKASLIVVVETNNY